MIELTDILSGSALKLLLRPARHYMHSEDIKWQDLLNKNQSIKKGMIFLFNDAFCYTNEEMEKKKPKQNIQQILEFSVANFQWRDFILVVQFESIHKHIIHFTFKSDRSAEAVQKILKSILDLSNRLISAVN